MSNSERDARAARRNQLRDEAAEEGSSSEEVFITFFHHLSYQHIALLCLFRRSMSILRMVRSPALRRFLPFLTIHDMFKALNAEGTNIQDLVRGRARRVVDAIIGLMPTDEEMAHAADVEVVFLWSK